MLNKIAVTHPGKIGDCLYCLPAIRYLSKKHNTKIDFWTSQYCAPLKNLFEFQSCINQFHVNHDYVMEHMNMGIQPWLLPVPDYYETVYHLGFRSLPNVNSICQHICNFLNIPNQEIFYEYPDIPTLDKDYVVVAPRSEEYWNDIIKDLTPQYEVVQIGAKGDYIGGCLDKTGLDFLETTTWIAKSKVFIGCQSSQLVLAQGFNISIYYKPQNSNGLICQKLVV